MLDLRRRQLITLLGGAVAAWPLAAHAQQPDRLRRIAVLSPLAEDDPEMTARLAGFRQGLEKRGWSEGRNVRIRRVQLALQAMRHTIPATYPFRDFSEAGGLMSYGASLRDALRQVGAYIVCVIAALMGFSLPTHAKNVKKSKSILPPPEFDHFYRGNISVKRDSAWSAPCRPISLSGRLGCAFAR